MRKPGMHAGNLATSERLQKLDAFLRLRGHRGATSIEITDCLDRPAASTDVSELRRNLRRAGEDVICTPEGRTPDGRKIFRYRIRRTGDAAVAGGPLSMASKPDAAGDLLSNPPPATLPSPDFEQMEQRDLFRGSR